MREAIDTRPLQTRLPTRYVDAMSSFSVSDRAAERVAEIVASQSKSAALRVAVLAGGCSGFQYKFELDEAPQPDDLVVEQGAARVLVDPASMDLLEGSVLDYTDALMGAHFTIKNPNATSACGCGTSFSVD
jgi:iron-sulfur cluster assembly accessory protein